MNTIRQSIFAIFLLLTSLSALSQQVSIDPNQARKIAQQAFVYGFPLVDNYRITHAYFIEKGNPEFKAGWNQLKHTPRVYTPDDKAVQTPNSDTPYSQAGLDLRAEPVILTVPPIQGNRYFSIQLVDGYTHNFAYIGSRATGNQGGRYLIVGPQWQGTAPAGIDKVIRSETNFVMAWYRTQLINPADLKNVIEIQKLYQVQPLSSLLGVKQSANLQNIEFIAPLTPEQQRSSLDFFKVLNFALQAGPIHPSETSLMNEFAKIGVGPGLPFDPSKLSPEIRQALLEGMKDGWTEFETFKKNSIDTGKITSGQLFGTREFLKNQYLYRMAAAVLGIYGNSREEAVYPAYFTDESGQGLNGANNQYRLHFAPGKLPPVNAFWSLTLYELPSSLLSANSINRYLINSPMLNNLKKDADGGITLYIQHQNPGIELETNWLPAPAQPFFALLRLYWPKDDALNGEWIAPQVQRAQETKSQ